MTISDNGKNAQEAENHGNSDSENGQAGNSAANAGDINSGSNSGNNGAEQLIVTTSPDNSSIVALGILDTL